MGGAPGGGRPFSIVGDVMKKQLLALSLCIAALGVHEAPAAAADEAATEPLRAIASLDVPRYMGTWFEIARYPNWFQKKCASDTRAEYSLQADGRVQVINRCRAHDGEWSEAVGMARQPGGADSAQLEVRFAPVWLSFLPMVWGDYWVIDLDPDYQLVAVSEPAREYLWVLARTPSVDQRAYEALLARLQARGFDPGRLERSVQHGN